MTLEALEADPAASAASSSSRTRRDGQLRRVVRHTEATTMAGVSPPEEPECEPEGLCEGKGIESSGSNDQSISDASFSVPSGQTASPRSGANEDM